MFINKCFEENKMKPTISYEDFAKLDLRIATIKKVEEIEGADKLYKLTLDVGDEIGERIVCAGIKEYFPDKKKLKGKQCVLLANLAPRKLKGIESQGMILACGSKDEGFVLLTPTEKVKEGSSVS